MSDVRKLGLLGLTGMVAGSMIGSGVFNLPSNMAQGASAGAVLIGWVVTFIGMALVANAFRLLANARPQLSGGVYTYAEAGFGRFVGFEMAWGYWLSAAFSNVAFAVLVGSIAGYFHPAFADAKGWPALAIGSCVIWGMTLIVLRGVTDAARLNVVVTAAKLIPLLFIVVVLIGAFEPQKFELDLWGSKDNLGSVFDQVKSTMVVTLWAFIGIEGAVVVSGRAKSPRLVGLATMIGFALAFTLYALVSLSSFGVAERAALAGLKDPSAAYLMGHLVGGWGATLVNIAVLVSVLGAWLAWTIMTVEVPYVAGRDGGFPAIFGRTNSRGAPAPALLITACVMQAMLVLATFADNAWIFLISVVGVMILPPYLASAAYLLILAFLPTEPGAPAVPRTQALLIGLGAAVYAVWLLYAAGPAMLLLASIFYALGMPVFQRARQERASGLPTFTKLESALAIALAAIAIVAVLMFAMGHVKV
ncbi:MAG: basic amino acid/polyamine antiporter [Burkholderiaceae bacterium]